MLKGKISKNHLSIAGGVSFILLALVILLSPGTAFSFLSKGIIISFGLVGFFVLVPFILILGIYLIFKNKMLKVRAETRLWGIFVIIISLLILTSLLGTQNYVLGEETVPYITYQNSIKILKDLISQGKTTFLDVEIGGGFFGFIVTGILNSLIKPVGVYIVSSILLAIGLVLTLHTQVKQFLSFIKNKIANKKNKKVEEVEPTSLEVIEENIEEEISDQPIPEVGLDKPLYESFHTHNSSLENGELRKAHFNFGNEESVINEDIPSPFIESPVVEETPVVTEENTNNFSNTQEVVKPEPIVEEPVVSKAPEHDPNDPLYRPQPKANLAKDYIYPTTSLLKLRETADDALVNESSCEERTNTINQIFSDLKVGASVVGHTVGPAVTRFDIKTNYDVSVAAVSKIIQDISVRLGGQNVRFEPIVYGKSTSGLEIPNEIRTNVGLRESIEGLPVGDKYRREVPFGRNISGDLVHADLSDFPHMLVSGTTGSGKTIFIHSVILTLLLRNKPEELKLMLIDPKKVEMSFYEDIPHLLCPNIFDFRKAYVAMKKLVDEMERRFNLFQANKVRDIEGFNEFAKNNDIQPLPYICVFIDEYADLVEQNKDIREPVGRLAQKARAAGIHLIIATQRPSVNIIEGTIKANVTTRVALMSASYNDSATIIGEGGAEKLLGHGDMLISCSLISRIGKPRVQGCYVSIDEINSVCDFLRSHYKTEFDPFFLDLEEHAPETNNASNEVVQIDKAATEEAQYQQIKEEITHMDVCSISFIQRHFAMGFPRAGRIFERLKKEGIVATTGDSRGNKVLVHNYSNEQQMGSIEQSTFVSDNENN